MSVSVLVTVGTESYKIFGRVITESASRANVMDLKILTAPAPLTTPTVSIQNFTAKLAIRFKV